MPKTPKGAKRPADVVSNAVHVMKYTHDDRTSIRGVSRSADDRGLNRIIIVGAVIAAMLLWLGPFSFPDWAVIGFVVLVLFRWLSF